MRKIKFRGKNIDSKDFNHKEFVYGCLDFRGCHDCPSDVLIIGEMNRGVWYVDRDTVGQLTGMYDCNGVEVYEGDICELLGYEGNYKFIVKWNDEETGFAMFRLDGTKSPVQVKGKGYKNLKIIGNIYDNIDLLIKKEK